MKPFVIVTDSCSDLSAEKRKKYDLSYIEMSFRFDGKEYPADLDWKQIPFEHFYDLMRNGTTIKTAQVNVPQYVEAFERFIKDGYDILSISCSSVLSSSYNGSLVAKEQLLEKYPDAKIVCIDSKNSCMGLGIMCIAASQMRSEGKTIDEVAAYIEEHKQEVNQFCTVESLTYLKKAGRVSAASAVFGGLLQVKPIIISDINGQNAAIEKVKGRKNSMNRIVEMFKAAYKDCPYQHVFVAHADAIEDAETLSEMINESMGGKLDIEIEKIGPIIGASAGPGTIAAYCIGAPVTFNSFSNEKK